VVYTSNGDLYEKPSLGTGVQTLVLHASSGPWVSDWSPDGHYLLYVNLAPDPGGDLWLLPLHGDRQPIPVAATRFLERDGQFSPDGKWIAYTSDESGEPQVYLQQFPEAQHKMQVSTAGGGMARWRRDGRELFYIALDDRLMAVTLREGRDWLDALAPVPLFRTRVGGPLQANSKQQYMVAPDGERFLMNGIAEEVAPPLTVVVNWMPGIVK
jgi:dipeptidyl aminopeptidase/acylaminoacyl peptidase